MACHGTAWCPLAHSARTQRDPAARVEVGRASRGSCINAAALAASAGPPRARPPPLAHTPSSKLETVFIVRLQGRYGCFCEGLEKMVFLVATTFVNELRARVRLSSLTKVVTSSNPLCLGGVARSG
jgi:hypothetical protein